MVFQSTPLTRGETDERVPGGVQICHFNPLPSHEGRHISGRKELIERYFNPLPSHEGRRRRAHMMRRAEAISIHSPHTRGDVPWAVSYMVLGTFQSTPLTRGETASIIPSFSAFINFNPLPSHEGRRDTDGMFRRPDYFNPLPSHEGRLTPCAADKGLLDISIHSPHTRGDRSKSFNMMCGT